MEQEGGQVDLRLAGPADIELLWQFLAIAAQEPTIAAARAIPLVAAHLAGWPRPGDFGIVARIDGDAVGAAWARQFSVDEEPSFHFGDETPEVSIAVAADRRGLGIGRLLLDALVAESGRRGLDLCLNVRSDNTAIALYERVGFRHVPGAEILNRAGGKSIAMLLSVEARSSASD